MEYFNDRVEDIRSRIPHSFAGRSDCAAPLPSFIGQGFMVFEPVSLTALTKVESDRLPW